MKPNRFPVLVVILVFVACRDPASLSPPPTPRPSHPSTLHAHEVPSCAAIVGTSLRIPSRPWFHAQVFMEVADSTGGGGMVDANAVHRLIRGQIGRMRACYETASNTQDALEGVLDVNFTIGPSGRLTRVSTTGLSSAPSVGACVTDLFRSLAFPLPEGGSVDFTFSFLFCPPERHLPGGVTSRFGEDGRAKMHQATSDDRPRKTGVLRIAASGATIATLHAVPLGCTRTVPSEHTRRTWNGRGGGA